MKTHLIKFATQSTKNVRGILAGLITTLIFFNLLPEAWSADLFWLDDADTPAHAGGDDVWETGTSNWSSTQTSGTPTPWVDGSIAHFLGSTGGGTVTLFSNITAAGIDFDPGASPFTIDTNGNTLTITGAGIVNTSGQTQTIFNNGALPGEGITPAGSTIFLSASTAGNVTIINDGSAVSGRPGGSTQFHDLSSAGSATITNNAATVSGGGGGFTEFFGTSTAGNATITNNGATISGAGGGVTEFFNNSTAGSATIITNGGTGGGSGGSTLFVDSSDGGTARAITNGNGSFDISSLATAGMGIGSIEGSGNYFLGSKTLTVGRNNLSTTVSGVIQDGGSVGGSGGSLVKVGTGTLTLTGANTYSGGTTISAGTLQLGNGGTTGSITGNVTDNGVLAFDRSDSVTFAGAIGGTGGVTQIGTGMTILTGTNTYSGGTTISSGTLQLGTGGTSGSIAGDVADNASLIFNRSDSLTFAGVISGGGSVTQAGTGTTILTANNTYTGGTTIAAGTLQLGNGGTSGSVVGNIVDNGVLAISRSDLITLAGVISGTGSLTQLGPGTLVLAGGNTYTGTTTMTGGILSIASGANLGATSSLTFNGGNLLTTGNVTTSVPVILAGNGTIDNGGHTDTFSGVFSGAGALTSTGAGTLILTANNTYTGGTTIAAGTLQLGNGGTTGSITGNVTDNGVLAFDRSDSVTFAGAISGTGSVTQIGTGTTILTGNNTYTGGTTISAGTLQAGSATALSQNSEFTVNSILDLHGFSTTIGSLSGTGIVLNNGATAATLAVGNDNASTTFSGVLQNGASALQLTKLGTGTLTLTGANTYSGGTTIDAGSLIVDGSIASQQTFVNAGGFLGGHGTIGGNLVNSGIVGPGNPPGTLAVANDYTQSAAGTLRIQVGGLAANQHDLLAVNGHVTLGGTLQLVRLGSFSLQPGDQIVFLTAQKGVSGAFDTVQNDFATTGSIVQGVVITSADEVVLEGKQGSFANIPGLTPNESAVAKMLDSAAADPRAAALFAFLNSQPLANLPNDLALIAPTGMTSINATAVSIGNVQIFNLEQRLANIQAGSTGFSSAGFVISGGAARFGEGFAGVSGPEGKSGPPVFAPVPQNRWGVFLTGLGEFTNVDSTSNAPGYDVNTGGFTLGVDYRVTPNFAIGLTAGYAHTSIGLDSPGGNIDLNAGTIGMYATIFGNGFYLDTAVSGGPSGYTTRRTALQGTANGSTNGGDLNILVAGGYDWTRGNLTIGPTASFQYAYVGLGAFTETGSLAPLKYPNQNTESERTAFGAKATYEWKIGHITAIPQVSAAWQHEFGDTAYSVVASLASGAGNSFTVLGPQIGRDSLLVGAGATVILNERVSAYLYYDGEFGRTNYLSNNVTGGVRISF